MDCIHKGAFTVTNPFTGTSRTIPAGPDHVHTIVFWSKNYAPFIGMNAHRGLEDKGYNLFFNFTVNAENPMLEPGIPGLSHRLKQVEALARDLDPSRIAWRFDPLCFFTINGQPGNNLKGFAAIADAMGDIDNISANACINGKLYQDLFGGTPETGKDYGQRRKQGCQCTKSVDVGSYTLHPCPHNCLFCYARTKFDETL